MVQIKGMSILETLKSSKLFYGEKELERIFDLLSPGAKKVFQEGIAGSEITAGKGYSELTVTWDSD